MTREIVGRVTEEEKNEILELFERKLGIEELTATLESELLTPDKKEVMQSKMITELGKAKLNLQAWWDKMFQKYKWKAVDGGNWYIDFQTCEIYITQ
ncbi:MAG: hypothetical protein BWY74_04351 [Firmicutes bacterium ADurb.Bin419]|nr:MAG: hypothetical protein BWY74_04351 [Firmicutes bacterium ADurb.Bin419]